MSRWKGASAGRREINGDEGQCVEEESEGEKRIERTGVVKDNKTKRDHVLIFSSV